MPQRAIPLSAICCGCKEEKNRKIISFVGFSPPSLDQCQRLRRTKRDAFRTQVAGDGLARVRLLEKRARWTAGATEEALIVVFAFYGNGTFGLTLFFDYGTGDNRKHLSSLRHSNNPNAGLLRIIDPVMMKGTDQLTGSTPRTFIKINCNLFHKSPLCYALRLALFRFPEH